MARKKVSDTIEQQRKAREEFLKLKQMQSGELAPAPKPSEEAIVPKTVGEKIANIWFHYKLLIIFGTFIAIVLTILVAQCATKVESDLDIVYFTYTPCFDAEIAQMEEYFEQYAEDINGDGQVKVSIINCSYSSNTQGFEYKNIMLQKMQATLVANEKAMLYITDSESIKYFDEIKVKGGNFFEGEPRPIKDDFFKKIKITELGAQIPEDLQVSIRVIEGTTLEKTKGVKEALDMSKKLLESITK